MMVKRDLLKHVIQLAPAGTVLTLVWLAQHGVSPKLAWWYVHAGWLARIGKGAYHKVGDTVSWVAALAALQSQLRLPVHIGGKTALALLGKVPIDPAREKNPVLLFAGPGTKLPPWLKNPARWGVAFTVCTPALFHPNGPSGLVERSIEGTRVTLSSPERALLEVLYAVPAHYALEEASACFEALGPSLRPVVIQDLFAHCRSARVKRLFLALAEKYPRSPLKIKKR